MRQDITILPEDLVDKIAAGEVVERPASVVKELVENSIDAGAKNISVEIKKGGMKSIRVTDDGVGMDEKNSALAFRRHATSKIKGVDDLFGISTLGFRGEALPSVASVSLLDVLSRTADDLSGTRLKIEGGTVREKKQMGAPVGTSVVVRELFYNVPARRKFLKTVLTETRRVVDLLTRFAIAYPEISFRLESDQRELFNFASADALRPRMEDVFGKNQLERMIEIKAEQGQLTVSGFVGKPEIARSNRAELYLYVNRRSIVSKSLYHAVQAGYGELLPKGKYPLAIIFIRIDPHLVDVNVHPTKHEVRFTDERRVHDLVLERIKETLGSPQTIPEFSTREGGEDAFRPGAFRKMGTVDQKREAYQQETPTIRPSPSGSKRPDAEGLPQRSFLSETEEKAAGETPRHHAGGAKERESSSTQKIESGAVNYWQLADTYILSQAKGSLVVLDQHASHERILYEEALRNLTGRQASAQQVLFPTVSELSPKEYQILDEHKELIRRLGFEVKHFGGRSILVTAVPTLVRNKSGEVFLKEILAQLEEEGRLEKDRVKAVAKSFACHGAVKAGERLSMEEMRCLVKQLFSTDEPYSCPHGRPTVIKLSLEELNKKFGRS
ncbi:MAG: DNA mismatch repair endonuclease MutL [Candidatus Zixiibacteriota bacterium]|nr:MAG: DNA mismatch repair endonuclease MutL [candidate division Zixibacteria bacterium]